MSMQERILLVNHPNLKIDAAQAPDAKSDLLDDSPTGTSSFLIEMLTDIAITNDIPIELTMVKTGHHDDGPHGHFGGFAADGWLLAAPQAEDWLDAKDPRFQVRLKICYAARARFQVGVAGSAQTQANRLALDWPASYNNGSAFDDQGPDHIHWGATDGSF